MHVVAAEAALASFSPEECMRLTERALALLGQAAAGPERDALELSIRTLHGLAAFRALGAGGEGSLLSMSREEYFHAAELAVVILVSLLVLLFAFLSIRRFESTANRR